MRPFALDANAIAAFQHERISGQASIGTAAIDAILQQGCIAIDSERLCLQEWIDCAGGAFPFALTDWIDNLLISGKIQYYGLSDNSCRKRLLQLGLPQKDHKWVRLALGSAGKVIVTGDVDFFDPSKKSTDAATKAKIRASGKGPCSRALSKEFGVEIVDTAATPTYLGIA